MAVTKTSVISVLVVLAITYNQGAARPMACASPFGSSSSEEAQWDCKFKIPTVIKEGLTINITGTLDPKIADKALIVELSKNGEDTCQFRFKDSTIFVKSLIDENNDTYELDVVPPKGSENAEGPSFSLLIRPRAGMLLISLYTQQIGQSNELFCKVNNIVDINQIDIIDGVVRINSLLFQYGV
ncbi:hypothetical protein PYW08_001503 [Mythimna loreyi]|uniref:Uncharacterized protein n=1 Tax=Mythimna loreyi TaxID=667449 RepID=A0ACC2R469_9NEOP|nr:hypothetical protein PYW08_001503 [Mythimna loreyi]